ncbi:MAG: hypothetical protein NC453_26665 [Muribaculum sp.]|nr:hypothetical protein [Muribaculum sp.]
MTFDIPSAEDISYDNVAEICGYQMLLCKMFERAGGFDLPRKTNATIREIQKQGLVWLRNVKQIMEGILVSSDDSELTLNALPRLIDSYDFFYRVCNGMPCLDFISKLRLKTVECFIAGNKTISQIAIVLMLEKEIMRNIKTVSPRYIDYIGRVTNKRIEELRVFGRLSDMSLEDTYLTLDYLLGQDLFAFGVRKANKLKWIEKYSLSEPEIDSLDLNTLWTYLAFSQSAMRLKDASIEEEDEQYVNLVSKIAAHPEVNKFVREAIELDLAKHKVA